MRESTKFNGKRNKETNTCRKIATERKCAKTPDMRSGVFGLDYYRT